jgi:ABC-type branched-subunit amino acid transport system substrate-binding protein
MTFAIIRAVFVLAIALTVGTDVALAEKKYDQGVTDTEIKIGQTVAYSGPVSAWGTIGRTQAAYFRKVNDEGGINVAGSFSFPDDGYLPAKTVEQVRKLIEQEEVFARFKRLNCAERRYPEIHKLEKGASTLPILSIRSPIQ